MQFVSPTDSRTMATVQAGNNRQCIDRDTACPISGLRVTIATYMRSAEWGYRLRLRDRLDRALTASL